MADRRTLHLGLTPPTPSEGKTATHCPIIRIVPRSPFDPSVAAAFSRIGSYTHLLFTSQPAVALFFTYLSHFSHPVDKVTHKSFIAVGTKTAAKIREIIDADVAVAEEETAEGIVSLLATTGLEEAFLFWPRSSLARPVIGEWLRSQGIPHASCALYDTHPVALSPLPDLGAFEEIVFTSPSTIDAFICNFGCLPKDKVLTCIGPVTRSHLEKSK